MRGTALRPALVWAVLALALAVFAQAAALTEPLASGRPLAERFTYLCVLALLAALGSVLNARTPGGKAWAVLMMVLVVVFLIPWLEDQTRAAPGDVTCAASPRCPWSIFYGLLVVVAVTNYLPTRFGPAAAGAGGALHPRIPRAVADGLAACAARDGLVVGRLDCWPRACASRAGAPDGCRKHSPRCERLWFWFRDNWGVVWALRVLERFNRAAEVSHWPVRLTWFGLVPLSGEAAQGRLPQPLSSRPRFAI